MPQLPIGNAQTNIQPTGVPGLRAGRPGDAAIAFGQLTEELAQQEDQAQSDWATIQATNRYTQDLLQFRQDLQTIKETAHTPEEIATARDVLLKQYRTGNDPEIQEKFGERGLLIYKRLLTPKLIDGSFP